MLRYRLRGPAQPGPAAAPIPSRWLKSKRQSYGACDPVPGNLPGVTGRQGTAPALPLDAARGPRPHAENGAFQKKKGKKMDPAEGGDCRSKLMCEPCAMKSLSSGCLCTAGKTGPTWTSIVLSPDSEPTQNFSRLDLTQRPVFRKQDTYQYILIQLIHANTCK